jgi:putative transposase
MIDATHKLPVTRQAALLNLSRSNVYYLPRPVPDADLALMRRIDELHLNFPFAGARMLRDMLKLEGVEVGRKHVRTLMDRMGIAAIYRKRNTSAPHPAHPIYPYLLKNLTIDRPNQAWASDITYIPMKRGFVYLVAIIDWATRRVLAHRVSISMTADFCVEALQEAIAKYGTPEIFNTDQGSQFTSVDFTAVLQAHGIRISMDGKGRWIDNVFVERLWRSVKYESIYLHAYETPREVRVALARYFTFYNAHRPPQSLGYRTPDEIYYGTRARKGAAA